MIHDRLSQARDILEDQQRHEASELSRRALLKHAAVAGGIAISGGATGGIASAAEPTDCSETTEKALRALNNSFADSFDKLLVIEGAGAGINHYQFSIGDAISSDEVVKAAVRDSDAPLISGEVQNQDGEVYYFSGKVTDVSTRGSITYSILE